MNHPPFTLRPGRLEDIAGISHLLIHIWRKNYSKFLPASFLEGMNYEKQLLRHQRYLETGTQYFIAENPQKQLLGFTSFGKNRSPELRAHWEIYTLYVDPEHQRMGLGKALLLQVIDIIDAADAALGVWVMEPNPYRAFYEKHGFKCIAEETMELDGFEIKNLGYVKRVNKEKKS